jgi:segregation and condensation protein A
VSDAIDRVVDALTRYEQLSLFDMNDDEPDRLERIVRFLAVLELYKQGVVDIEQLESFGDLVVRARPFEADNEIDLDAFNRAADEYGNEAELEGGRRA